MTIEVIRESSPVGRRLQVLVKREFKGVPMREVVASRHLFPMTSKAGTHQQPDNQKKRQSTSHFQIFGKQTKDWRKAKNKLVLRHPFFLHLFWSIPNDNLNAQIKVMLAKKKRKGVEQVIKLVEPSQQFSHHG